MSVRVITPAAPLVDLELAKKHLRVDSSDEDTLIDAYIAAASAAIDGPGGWLDRAIGVQTLEASFCEFGCDLIPLAFPPLIAAASVKYDDTDGAEQTIDDADYTLDPRGVLLASGSTWPTAQDRAGSVRVRYTAGYVVDASADPLVAAIPAPIIAAVLLMVGDLYANRETASAPQAFAVPMSTTVQALLGPYRVLTV